MTKKAHNFLTAVLFIAMVLLSLFFLALVKCCNAQTLTPTPTPIIKEHKFKLDKNEIKIGDKNSNKDFDPKVEFSQWDKEEFIGFEYQKNGFKTPLIIGNSVASENGKETIKLYPDSEKEFKFDIILKEKPDINIFTFKVLNHQNFEFLYQTPFPQIDRTYQRNGEIWIEYDNGQSIHKRPLKVDGSYAIYHKYKKNDPVHKTGKFGHLYNSYIYDNDNNSTWGKLSISGNKLTITVSQEFLDSAFYPVTIDPNFGYDTQGGSLQEDYSNTIRAYYLGTAPESGTITSLCAYVDPYFCEWLAYGFYDDTGGSGAAGTIQDASEEANVCTSPDWYCMDSLQGYTFSSGNDYYFAIWVGPDTDQYVEVAYDSDNSYDYYYKSGATYPIGTYDYSDWTSPLSGTYFDGNQRQSAYVVYSTGITPTQTQTQTATQTMTPTLTVTPTPTCTVDYNYITFGLNTTDDYTGYWEDTFVKEDASTTNYGSETSIIVGNVTNEKAYIHLRIDISAIPDGLDINNASLHFNLESDHSTQHGIVEIYELTGVPGTSWTESGDTYQKYDGSNDWTSQAGGYSDKGATLLGDALWHHAPPHEQFILFNADGLTYLENMTAGGDICNLIIAVDSTWPRECQRTCTSSEGSDGFRPYLKICYAQTVPTPTTTPTQTMTVTITPTMTPTMTPTVTQTVTKTPTVTVTATNTVTATVTQTQTPTQTQTITPTQTVTLTQTQTPTATAVPTCYLYEKYVVYFDECPGYQVYFDECETFDCKITECETFEVFYYYGFSQ